MHNGSSFIEHESLIMVTAQSLNQIITLGYVRQHLMFLDMDTKVLHIKQKM